MDIAELYESALIVGHRGPAIRSCGFDVSRFQSKIRVPIFHSDTELLMVPKSGFET